MMEKVWGAIFSFSGASVLIGVAGALSAFTTMFVDVNDSVSVKYFLFALLIFVYCVVILLKLIHDLARTELPPSLHENPIRYVESENVFVIRRNESFLNNVLVGCYVHQDEIDRLAYVGFVHLVQEKVIQIRVLKDLEVLGSIPRSEQELKNISLRPVVPFAVVQQLFGVE